MLGFINLTSPMHLLVILVVALLLFGSRLPEVARSMGRAINEFKRGLREVEEDLKADETEPAAGKSPPRLSPPADTAGVSRSSGEQVKPESSSSGKPAE